MDDDRAVLVCTFHVPLDYVRSVRVFAVDECGEEHRVLDTRFDDLVSTNGAGLWGVIKLGFPEPKPRDAKAALEVIRGMLERRRIAAGGEGPGSFEGALGAIADHLGL